MKILAACALAAISLGVFAGCGKSSTDPGEEVREGLSTPLGGLRYTVFLTRQLNLANEQDRGYLPGYKDPGAGQTLYAVFLEACNKGDEGVKQAVGVDRFVIEDTQGNTYEPEAIDSENPFAYHGGPVEPKNCMPARGSLAQLGPASGAMLLFKLPVAATENRPLKLRIEGDLDPVKGEREKALVILDV